MSADNYYMIRNHPKGGYAVIMGFASQEETREATEDDKRYETPEDAIVAVLGEYAEYGIQLHPEVENAL